MRTIRSLPTSRRVYANQIEDSSSTPYLNENKEYFGDLTVVENHIYFYQEVTPKSIMELGIAIKTIEQQLINLATNLELEQISPIHLHLNSGGGCVFSGLAGAGHILNSQIPVFTYVEGSAASAATILSCVGAKRHITEHSFMLIHQISTGVWGTYENLKDEKESMDSLMEMINGIYLKHTNLKKKNLKELLKRDLWITPQQCLELGLVDEVIQFERT